MIVTDEMIKAFQREYSEISRESNWPEYGAVPDYVHTRRLLIAAIEPTLALTPANSRAEAIRECIAVVEARAKAYEMHLDKGKGQHGQLNYVRDSTWDNWQGHFSEASQIATMLRDLLQQEGE